MELTKDMVTKKTVDPEKVWEYLMGYASYAFNSSHSAAYALVAYATASLWTHHRNEVLEYLLNDGAKDNFQMALNKCKELGMRMNYPDLFNMGNPRYQIVPVNGHDTLMVPLDCDRKFDSYVSFLTSDDVPVVRLILKGVCDGLTYDRGALADLYNCMLAKYRKQAAFMEPKGVKWSKLDDIMEGLRQVGALQSWEKKGDGLHCLVTRANGKEPTPIWFHNDDSPYNRLQRVRYDVKEFGAPRAGILSPLPYVEHARIERELERLREFKYSHGEGDYAFKALQNRLRDHMREYHGNRSKNVFGPIYALVTDSISYARSTKLFLDFDNCSDILYVKGEAEAAVKKAGKNCLVEMVLEYSPYIARKTEKFVYDFDILSLKVITGEEGQ